MAYRTSRFAARVAALAVCALFAPRASADGMLNPSSFASLGTFAPAAGDYSVITTGTKPTLSVGGTTYSGVYVDQGAGLQQVAVFTFDSVTIGNGVAVNLRSTLPVAILSKSDLTVSGNGTVRVSGGIGGFSSSGPAGAGGGSGGGNPSGSGFSQATGTGPGASTMSGTGSGGGFVGPGGNSSSGLAGGAAYGTTDAPGTLRAGSGGGYSYHAPTGYAYGGGSGGGGVALVANGTLSIADTGFIFGEGGMGGAQFIDTVPGAGGGGSGGNVVLGGNRLVVTTSKGIDVDGGAGGDSAGGGAGGGSGGRIYLRPRSFTIGTDSAPTALSARGGAGGKHGGGAGSTGSIVFAPETVNVPTGQVFTLAALPTNATFTPTNFALDSNSLAAISGNFSLDGTILTAPGSNFAVSGSLNANALILQGSTASAPGGFIATNGALSGYGVAAGPYTPVGINSKLTVASGTKTLTVGDANLPNGFVASGTVSLNENGTLNILSAQSATLGVNNNLLANSTINAPKGATLLAGRKLTASGNGTFNGNFINAGTVTGPTNAGQALTFSGNVQGTGSFSGNVAFTGSLSPGATAASSADLALGSASFDPTTALLMDLGGSTAGSGGYDRLSATGTLTLGGMLNLSLVTGYSPTFGVQHRLVNAASISGTFATISGVVLSNTRALAVTYDATGVTVTAALPGDFDVNGKVEFADLLTLAKNYNATAGKTWATGDTNGDGAVAFADLLTLARNYNKSVSAADAASLSAAFAADFALAQSLVPEPTSLALLGGLAALLRRRR